MTLAHELTARDCANFELVAGVLGMDPTSGECLTEAAIRNLMRPFGGSLSRAPIRPAPVLFPATTPAAYAVAQIIVALPNHAPSAVQWRAIQRAARIAREMGAKP